MALPSAIAHGPWETSRGKTQSLRDVGAGSITHPPARMEDCAVTCPLVPGVPHLLAGSCASPRICGLGFLQTPPRGDALALLLACGCAHTGREDLPLASSVPCPAHTLALRRALQRVACSALFEMGTQTPCKWDVSFSLAMVLSPQRFLVNSVRLQQSKV